MKIGPRTRLSLTAAVVMGALLGGPNVGCDKIEEIVENRVRERARNTRNGEDPGEIEANVQINSVRPNRSDVLGGEIIEIVGFGFRGLDFTQTAEVEVLFGPSNNVVPSPFVDVVSDTLLRVSVPPFDAGECELPVTIRVTVDTETASLPEAFTYFQPVELDSVAPARGPTSGGTLLTMAGRGFVEGTQVQIGEADPVPASILGCSGLRAITPTLPRGTLPVRVLNENGSATLVGAFETYDEVTLSEIAPIAVPLAGGTETFAVGTGFIPGTVLTVDGNPVSATTNEEETVLTFSAPPGAAEGPVPLTVDNENGSASLNRSLFYFDELDPTPRIVAVTPQASRPEGGGTVSVIVAGFDNASTQIFIDGIATICTPDLHILRCTVPASPGEQVVDVRAVNGADVAVLSGGFEYIDLRLDSLLPNRGAIAGDTWVQMFGNGFRSDTRVFFGGRLATEVVVLSPTELTVYTPPAFVGLSSVSVESLGLLEAEDDFFEYFDPFLTPTATGGGRIEGAVNITVTDSSGRVADAFVTLGSNPSSSVPHTTGFTNELGQVTLSGPTVFGAQTVHASKPGGGSYSWVGVDAENLKMSLSNFPEPPPDPLPECPQGGGGAPPLIEGSVLRIKDEFNSGLDTVVVTTTFASTGTPLPLPGDGNQMISQGDYSFFARTGDLMVIALAGTLVPNGDPFNPGDNLDVHAIGVRPFLFTEASSGELCLDQSDCTNGEQCRPFGQENFCLQVYEDIDIVIDIPVNEPLLVELENPPSGISTLEFGAAPSQTLSSLWYSFGTMGVFPAMDYPLGPYDPFRGVEVPPVVLPLTDNLIYDTPAGFPEDLAATFQVTARVSGQGGFGDRAWSESFERDLPFPQTSVRLGPYLPVHRDDSPGVLQNATTAPMSLAWTQLPAGGLQPSPTVSRHVLYTVISQPVCLSPFGPVNQDRFLIYWTMYAPGHISAMDLPTYSGALAGANIPFGELVLWQTNGYLTPGLDFNQMNPGDVASRVSQSLRTTGFNIPFPEVP